VASRFLQVIDMRVSHYPRYFLIRLSTTHGQYLIHESKSDTIPFIHYSSRKNMAFLSPENSKIEFKFGW
jgi:hypothetical protein